MNTTDYAMAKAQSELSDKKKRVTKKVEHSTSAVEYYALIEKDMDRLSVYDREGLADLVRYGKPVADDFWSESKILAFISAMAEENAETKASKSHNNAFKGGGVNPRIWRISFGLGNGTDLTEGNYAFFRHTAAQPANREKFIDLWESIVITDPQTGEKCWDYEKDDVELPELTDEKPHFTEEVNPIEAIPLPETELIKAEKNEDEELF